MRNGIKKTEDGLSEVIRAIAEGLSVYVNLLTDFGFKKPERHLSCVQLMNKKTYEVFNDNLNIVCLGLPRFGIELKDVKTFPEQA